MKTAAARMRDKRRLSRRALLRGALGASAALVGLPTLECMLDSHGEAFADGSSLPLRLVIWFWGNGIDVDRWVPADVGAGYALSDILAPLAGVKDYCSVLSGFKVAGIDDGHQAGTSILSGYAPNEGLAGGPTVDQVVADRLAGATPIRSLELGVLKDVRKDYPVTQFISHRGANEPQPPEYSPQRLFTRLFGGSADGVVAQLSVLDAVREDASELRSLLGKTDSQRLGAHLEGIYELEQEIQALSSACTPPQKPTETNEEPSGMVPIEDVNRAMSDLLAYAFSCDLTRVASVMFTGPAAEHMLSPGSSESIHYLSHQNNDEFTAALVRTTTNIAYLLERLRDTSEGTGNLLDRSAVLCTSEIGSGQLHTNLDRPLLVAGKAGGALRHPGIHHRSASAENGIDVVLALAQAVVPEIAEIGGGATRSDTPSVALAP
jgi:hypothetical protein